MDGPKGAEGLRLGVSGCRLWVKGLPPALPSLSWQVFEAVLAWVRYDRDQRGPCLPELLSNIRLPLCRPQFLSDRVQQDDLVRCCHKCR